jgi:YD repeat-containing protein
LLKTKTDAASESVTYTYNARGQLDVKTLARGGTVTYTYRRSGQTFTVKGGRMG